MENDVLVSPKVQTAFQRFELAALFQDFRTPEETANKDLHAERFGTATIPAYYVLDPSGKLIARQEGSASEEDFLKFLDGAK